MDGFRISRHAERRYCQLLIGLPLLAAYAPSLLAQSTCLIEDDRKVCIALATAPDDLLQPSNVGSAGETFVVYNAVLTNIENQSAANVYANFELTPGASISRFEVDAPATCINGGASLSCDFRKQDITGPVEVLMEVRLPDFVGAATPAEMSNQVRFGWEGRSASVRSSVPMAASGYSYVPANRSVTLVTAEEVADPAQQTTATLPLFGRMVVPAAPFPRLARLRLNGAGPDLSPDCPLGLFLQLDGDGGPFVCRDTASPTRWIEASLEGDYPDDPIELTMIVDASLVPPTQLPPTLLTPRGTPIFAMFFNGGAADSPNRAFAADCAVQGPPCVSRVVRYGTGDWSATLRKTTLVEDGVASGNPLLPLQFQLPDGSVGAFGFIPSEPPVSGFLR